MIESGDPGSSSLIDYVESQEMPPGQPLSSDEMAILQKWISDGAYFPPQPIDPFAVTTGKRAGLDWWSLQPLSEGTTGRDHNPDGFTCWMMGAGVKGGISYGATDEFGRGAVENPATVWDFYATVLHALGFQHERLTSYYNGLGRRLTDVHGKVIREILS